MKKYTREYFRHDYNTRTDEKIIRLIFNLGWAGYGIYWALVELIYIGDGKIRNDYTMIAHELRTTQDVVEKVVNDFDLFYEKDGQIRSKAINKRLEEREGISEKRAAAATSKWQNTPKNRSKAPEKTCENTNKATEEVGEKLAAKCGKTQVSPMNIVDANASAMLCKSNAIYRIGENRIEQDRTVTTTTTKESAKADEGELVNWDNCKTDLQRLLAYYISIETPALYRSATRKQANGVFKRYGKAASELLSIAGDLDTAKRTFDLAMAHFNKKGLSWNLSTVAANSAEFVNQALQEKRPV